MFFGSLAPSPLALRLPLGEGLAWTFRLRQSVDGVGAYNRSRMEGVVGVGEQLLSLAITSILHMKSWTRACTMTSLCVTNYSRIRCLLFSHYSYAKLPIILKLRQHICRMPGHVAPPANTQLSSDDCSRAAAIGVYSQALSYSPE